MGVQSAFSIRRLAIRWSLMTPSESLQMTGFILLLSEQLPSSEAGGAASGDRQVVFLLIRGGVSGLRTSPSCLAVLCPQRKPSLPAQGSV